MIEPSPNVLAGQGTPRAANDTRLAAAWSAIDDPSVTVFTADVFDTLVFRTVRRPVDAFAILGAELARRGMLAPRLPPDSFQPLRKDAERQARERLKDAIGSHEVTIREIYDALAPWVFAPGVTADDVIAVEVEVERDLVVPDLEVSALLAAAQEAGKRLALVSDNYLGSAHLESILAQPPLGGLTFDAVFCSCDHRTGKGGDLWPIVLRELGVRPSQIVHVGDNPDDDIDGPREHGIRTVFYSQRPDEHEETLAEERRLVPVADGRPLPAGARTGTDFGLTALRGKVLGADHGVPEGMRPFWAYGASVLGPSFAGFAEWIVREARLLGFGRVNCLMREGALLSDLVRAADAARYAGWDEEPLHVQPLWLNRRTCLVASLSDLSEDELERVYAGRTSLTLRQSLALLGLTTADVPPLAGHADTRLDDEILRETLIGELQGEEVRAKASAHARMQRHRVVRLLERAASDDGRVLLVDLGWGASIQALADRCLRLAGSELHTVGLYLMTHKSATPRMVQGSEAYGFLTDCGGPADLTELVMRSPEILEQVTTADAGSQLGLTEDLDPICEPLDPRLEDQRREGRWARAGIRAFQDLWNEYRSVLPGRLGDLSDARPQLLAQLARALVLPTASEAALFGDWHHDEGKGSTRLDALAGADRLDLVSHATPRQLRHLPMRDVYWPFGLGARASEHHTVLMAAVAAGLIPWEATEGTIPIGNAELRGVEGVWGTDEDGRPRDIPRGVVLPTRNVSGNTLIPLSIQAPDLRVVELQVGFKPHLLRVDWLKLRMWEQGNPEPRTVVLADADNSAARWVDGYVELVPNTFAAPAPRAVFVIDLVSIRDQVTYAVDVELGCAVMQMPAPLSGQLRNAEALDALASAERVIAGMESSISWRVTRPLRAAKRRLGR